MRGETVTVIRRVEAGVDEGNDPVYEDVPEDVGNVLVGPASGSNSGDSTRPDGVQVDATLYFPRSYPGGSVRGCDVLVRGDLYHVVGDPFPVDGGMAPTAWNMAVDVTRSEG